MNCKLDACIVFNYIFRITEWLKLEGATGWVWFNPPLQVELLNTFKDGKSTTYLANLCLFSSTPTVQEYLLMFRCQMYCVLLCAYCLWSCHWEPLKESGSTFGPTLQVLAQIHEILRGIFLFPGQIVAAVADVHRRDAPDSIIFMVLHRLSPVFLFYWGSRHTTFQH